MPKVLSRDDAFTMMSEGLLVDETALRREYRKRSSLYDLRTVPHSDVEELLKSGWELQKALKRTTRLRKEKRFSVQLEDDVWCLLKRAGYGEMNKRSLRVPFEQEDGSVDLKQVDVFAKDEETVLIVECKARTTRGRRSLQKDLAETRSFKTQMVAAVRAYYGREFKPKFIFVYATKNIIWSEKDLERAASVGVKVLTENELNYYDAFIRHMGPAGRFQVLAEFLEGQKIPELDNVQVPAIRGKMGGEKYYAFVTTPKHLLKISFVNHLALNHPEGRPAYQRMVKNTRLKKIAEFIGSGGFFPTNLLVNFTDQCRFDLISTKDKEDDSVKFGMLTLPSRYKSAWIIDGQHRLYGYSFLDESYWNQSLFVLAFEKLDQRKEAELFITINHEQKSVPKSILVSLQSDLKWGSESSKDRMAAIASGLVKSLASDRAGPLGLRFVIEGVPATDGQSLTIPEVVKGVDRSRLVGRIVNKIYVPGPLAWSTDEETLARAKRVINGYFEIVREANPGRWEQGRAAYVSTNPGVRAHLLLLAEIIQDLAVREGFEVETARESAVVEKLVRYLQPVVRLLKDASDEEIYDRFSRKFGEGGVREYFYELCEIVCSDDRFEDFGSAEFKEYMVSKSDTRYESANSDVMILSKEISDYIYDVLVDVYGADRVEGRDEAYWEVGISSAKAKASAYNRQQETPVDRRLHKFAYLDILPLRDIVKQQNNWKHFSTVFNIPLPGEKGKKYYLDWMERFNELRRIPAHPSKHRLYKAEDYDFLEWLKKEFYARLEAAKNKDALAID